MFSSALRHRAWTRLAFCWAVSLTEYYGWRSVFYVNIPVGLLACGLFRATCRTCATTTSTGRSALDWPGAVLIALALGGLQFWWNCCPARALQ